MSSLRPPRTLGAALIWVGGGALAGALCGARGPWPSVVALGLSSALAVVGLRVGLRPRAWLGPALAVLAFLAAPSASPPRPPTGTAELTGLVVEVEATRGAIVEVDEAHVDGRSLAVDRVALDVDLDVGESITARATLRPPTSFRNESPHPSIAMSGARVVRGRDAIVMTRERSQGPIATLARAREDVRRAIHASLASDVAGLVAALVLGDASLAESDAIDARAAGLSHVIAVSGMHVTLVVGAIVLVLTSVLRRAPWITRRTDPRAVAWWIGAVLAPLYAAFAGGSASAWRAAITASLTWILAARGRSADPIAVTALVIVIGCVVTPEAIASPAFVLSVLATAAVLEPRRHDDEARSFATLRTLLRASVRASVATAPFTLWCFGALPPLSIVANVVVVPIVAAVLLPLGTVHAMLASISIELSSLTAPPTEHVVRAFLTLSSFFADAGTGLALPPLDTAELSVIGLTSYALLRARDLGRTAIVISVALVALVACEAHLRWREHASDGLRITFLDVGQGDAALIDLPDGQLWLVDTGGASFGSRRDPGIEAIVPVLAARRRARVDVAVITHPHPDHYGGFAGVASRVIVGELWDSGQARDEMPDGSWRRGHRGLLVPIHDPETLCGAPRVHGGARIEVIWPCPRFDAGYDANDNSLVLRITYGRRTFLLLGDAERHTEAALASRLGRIDVVKVGHHGSRTSSTEAFVETTRPWLAVISAGLENRYGHPHEEVLARWNGHADHVARTDLDGSVSVWTDGERLEARTFSGRALEAPVGREILAGISRP